MHSVQISGLQNKPPMSAYLNENSVFSADGQYHTVNTPNNRAEVVSGLD